MVLAKTGPHHSLRVQALCAMSDCNKDPNQTDEEIILRDEVSDEAVEAASIAPVGLPTLMHNTYCFACPVDNPQQAYSDKNEARRIAVNICDE